MTETDLENAFLTRCLAPRRRRKRSDCINTGMDPKSLAICLEICLHTDFLKSTLWRKFPKSQCYRGLTAFLSCYWNRPPTVQNFCHLARNCDFAIGSAFRTGVRSQMARLTDDVDYANGNMAWLLLLRGLTDCHCHVEWWDWGNILRRRTTFSHTNVVAVVQRGVSFAIATDIIIVLSRGNFLPMTNVLQVTTNFYSWYIGRPGSVG